MGEASVADEGLEPMPPFEELAPAAGLFKMWNLCAFCQCPNVEDEKHGPMVEFKCHPSFPS